MLIDNSHIIFSNIMAHILLIKLHGLRYNHIFCPLGNHESISYMGKSEILLQLHQSAINFISVHIRFLVMYNNMEIETVV